MRRTEIFLENNVVEGKIYHGYIKNYDVTKNNMLRVFVVVDDYPEEEFLCSMKIDVKQNTRFSKFCRKMYLVKKNNKVNLDLLIEADYPVYVDFRQMEDGTMLIDNMEWDLEADADDGDGEEDE